MNFELNDAILTSIATLIGATITIFPGLVNKIDSHRLYNLRIGILIFPLLLITLFLIRELPIGENKTVSLTHCLNDKYCGSYCGELPPNSEATLTYTTKGVSFTGSLTVKNLIPKKTYLFSLHNIPYHEQTSCLLPFKMPDHLVENFVDLDLFKTDHTGAATLDIKYARLKPCDQYEVQARLKDVDSGYKNVMCFGKEPIEIKIVDETILIVWFLILAFNIYLLIVTFKSKPIKTDTIKNS